MPTVDVIDEVFVVADPADVRAATCSVERWRAWFPELALTPYDDRRLLGVRWHLSGALVGTAEVWLEVCGDGVIVHTYLRADPADTRRARSRGRAQRLARRYALAVKRHMTAVKDELEAGRAPGVPRVPLADRPEASPAAAGEGRDAAVSRSGRPRRPPGPGRSRSPRAGRPRRR